jgi:copper chaperone CopZ
MILLSVILCSQSQAEDFFQTYCHDCHGTTTQEATLDLTSLSSDFTDEESFRRWVKVYDRIASGEMPPKDAQQPTSDERNAKLFSLKESLQAAEQLFAKDAPRLRRLTRTEYEYTIRDLFDMPGIALANNLPADGSAQGFDKHVEALDISHVNIAKYLEAADHILDYAIATRPKPPTIHTRRISLVNRGGFVAHIVMNGDGVLLKSKQPDPEFPPAAEQNHLDQGAHERWGSFRNGATVGLFRHEDESVSPYFMEHVTIYPARYRVRTSLWGFQWDQGQMLPGRGTEAARLSVVQLTGDGRGGQHPSYVLGYFNAPETHAQEHELTVWLNHNELIGFNTASLAPTANYNKKRRAMEFTGPGIAVDWLDVEGPLYETWPPQSHQVLFGDHPLVKFDPGKHPETRLPSRKRPRQIGAGRNRPDPELGLWSVQSEAPLVDADRLLADFLPRLFRRAVSNDVRQQYVGIVQERIKAGDCFELAMRAAYRNALVSPDFLYHIEPTEKPDDDAIACRLSYFLWNSLPDAQLLKHVEAKTLTDPQVFHSEIERLLRHPRSQRFIDDFLGQWLKLSQIASTDPDKKLYPEFSPYLQDTMVAETRAYFRELLEKDLDASHFMKSDFVIVNEKLAAHYDIPGVRGTQMRRVSLPADCPRGGFLTQASILKITANGTTTSPVPRGAFVLDRLLGEPPEPPPANVAAIEPDVRGTTTIREQLEKHRDHTVCASCHQRIDPPGFALEAFDVIGGYRNRYRSIGEGDSAPRGSIDPLIGISFRLGQIVDTSSKLVTGENFENIQQYQALMTNDHDRLLRNIAEQFVVYSTGRSIQFSDQAKINEIVRRTKYRNGGIRTLLHEVIASTLFTGQTAAIKSPQSTNTRSVAAIIEHPHRMMMATSLPSIDRPVVREPETVQKTKAREYQFDNALTVTVQVTGLFMSQRVDDFKSLMAQFPEARLQEINFETAIATIVCSTDSDEFQNAKPEQAIDRLNNRIRHLSNHTIGATLPSRVPPDQLERIEIPITGLDCMACSMAVYEILKKIEGVERITASFRDRLTTAWIDPTKTNRQALENALKQRGVSIVFERDGSE